MQQPGPDVERRGPVDRLERLLQGVDVTETVTDISGRVADGAHQQLGARRRDEQVAAQAGMIADMAVLIGVEVVVVRRHPSAR